MERAPDTTAPDKDRLLSVEEVAVRLGVKPNVVAYYLARKELISLDEGRLVSKGHFKVPVIRDSEVTRLQEEWAELSNNKERASKIEYPGSIEEHPGLHAAFLFLAAMQEKNAAAAFVLSSKPSQDHFKSPRALFQWWRQYLGAAALPKMGVTNGVYSLPRHQAIAVRFVADTMPSGVVIRRTTLVPAAIPIALINEDGNWKVDYPLQERRAEWEADAGVVTDAGPAADPLPVEDKEGKEQEST